MTPLDDTHITKQRLEELLDHRRPVEVPKEPTTAELAIALKELGLITEAAV